MSEVNIEVYRDGHVYVRKESCDRCLFSPNRLVPGSTARQIVAETRANGGGNFVCHKGYLDLGDGVEPQSICRAWFDAFGTEDEIINLAIMLGIVRYVGD